MKKEYVPAQLRVIVIAPQRIICDSGSPSEDTPGSQTSCRTLLRHAGLDPASPPSVMLNLIQHPVMPGSQTSCRA